MSILDEKEPTLGKGTIPKKKKARIYEEDVYDIIRPYNTTLEIFNREKFSVEIIKRNGRRLVIIREKKDES